MSDIVERLRSIRRDAAYTGPLLHEAADEIERLKAMARGWYDQNVALAAHSDKVWDENKKLRAEVERLRAVAERSAKDIYPRLTAEIERLQRQAPQSSAASNACEQEEGA